MITINNVEYSASKILITDLYEGDVLTLISDSTHVTWKIEKHPTIPSNQEFHFQSGDSISTRSPEYLPLDLVGGYYLTAIERNANGNYSNTKIYIRANNLALGVSFPFNTEDKEVDDEGWGKELMEHVLTLSNAIVPLITLEIDNGYAFRPDDETILEVNCGMANSVFGYTFDGGTANSFQEQNTGGGLLGFQSQVNADLAKATGIRCIANSVASNAIGLESETNNITEESWSCGKFEITGDAQSSKIQLKTTTTALLNTNRMKLQFVNPITEESVTEDLVIPINTAWKFNINIIAMTDNASLVYSKTITGNISRGSSNSVFNGDIKVISEEKSIEGLTWTISLDNTDNIFAINVTGDSINNIRWLAEMNILKVKF